MKNICALFIIVFMVLNALYPMNSNLKKRDADDTFQSDTKKKWSKFEMYEEHVNDLFSDEIAPCQKDRNLTNTSNVKNSILEEFSINYFIKPVSMKSNFTCGLKKCDYTTNDYDSLQNHYQQENENKIYKCDFIGCSFATKNERYLTIHKYTHTGEKPYRCRLCLYSTTTKSNLKKHMENHGANKQFACDKCNYSCFLAGVVKRHLKKHH